MPSLSVIKSRISELSNGVNGPIVAALPGGTTGIGAYIAKALATIFANNGAGLRVYIVGRNTSRAESVMAECRVISPGSDWRFVQTPDLALVSEVDRCCAEILRQEQEVMDEGEAPRIDLLYMTYSYFLLKKRTSRLTTTFGSSLEADKDDAVTKEGLDAFLSTVYYTRIRFIMQLLPLLTASRLSAASVVSVYAGTFEDGTKSGQFPIGCPSDATYGISTVRKHTSFMKTFVFEELADKNSGKIRLTHIYPGLVDGPGFNNPEAPMWFKIVWRLMKPLMGLYMTSPEVCGQVMLYLATEDFPARADNNDRKSTVRSSQGVPGGGAYSVGQRGDAQKGIMYEKVRKADTSKRIWDHTMAVLERAAKTG